MESTSSPTASPTSDQTKIKEDSKNSLETTVASPTESPAASSTENPVVKPTESQAETSAEKPAEKSTNRPAKDTDQVGTASSKPTEQPSEVDPFDAVDFPMQMEEKATVIKALDNLLSPKKGQNQNKKGNVSKGIDETEAKKLRKTIDDLSELNAKVEPDKTILKKSEQLRQRIHKQVEKREKDYEAACSMMDELEAAVKKNELTEAEQKEKKIITLVSRIPGLSEQRSQGLEKRLRRARPKLNALESWRHWGTTQARDDLVAQMKQLDGTRMNPEKLAKTIRDARDQWRDWEKSGDHSNKKLWEEFDKACEKAYEPCVAHFDKLKKQRDDNLQQAKDLLKKLDTYYDQIDWKKPEWKAIDRTLRFARRDFFKIGNIDFKHRKKLRVQLDELSEKYETHLGRERTRSLKTREKLILDVEALADNDNTFDALKQLDQIRKQWVPTVLEKRGVENALWQRFQTAGDLIYAKRNDQRKEEFAERDENLKQKSAIVEDLVIMAQSDATTLLGNASKVAQAKEAWQAIGSVPRKVEKNLQNRWQDAQKAYRNALKAAQNLAKNAQMTLLVDKATFCGKTEQATLKGETTTGSEEEWQAMANLSDPSMENAIQARFKKATKITQAAELKKNKAAIEEACLKLELALDLDSPAEFAKQRMAFQIARLSASMKKDTQSTETPVSLIKAILTTGAIAADVYESLQKRVEDCSQKVSSS